MGSLSGFVRNLSGSLGLTLAALLWTSCSGDDGGDSGPTTGGSGGGAATGGSVISGGSSGSTTGGGGSTTGGSGGSTTGGSGGVVITDVPDAWERPAECGGIGEDCTNCGELSVCQLMNDTCVPRRAFDNPETNTRTEETPYCMSYVCMTFEEASCYCTGTAGSQLSQCQDGPAGVAGLCESLNSSCLDTECCGDLACVKWGPTSAVCYQPCANASECETGCCTDRRDTGDLVCAPTVECETPCGSQGEPCESNEDCCRGLCAFGSSIPEWNGCQNPCLENSDCDTGCCQPFTDSANGFCAEAQWCGCGAEEAPCGSNQPACCDGLTCVGGDPQGTFFECRPICQVHEDCESLCCIQITGQDYGACLDPSWCNP